MNSKLEVLSTKYSALVGKLDKSIEVNQENNKKTSDHLDKLQQLIEQQSQNHNSYMEALLTQQKAQIDINKEVQVRITKFEKELASMRTAMEMEKQATDYWRRDMAKDISKLQPAQATLSEETQESSSTSSISSQEETIKFERKTSAKSTKTKRKLPKLFCQKKRKNYSSSESDNTGEEDSHSNISLESKKTTNQADTPAPAPDPPWQH